MVHCTEIYKEFKELLTPINTNFENTEVSEPKSTNAPSEKCVLYVPTQKVFDQALSSSASLLIIDKKINAENSKTDKAIFSSSNLQLSMALINQRFFTAPNYKTSFNKEPGVHKTAHVATTATIGKNVSIGPGVTIHDNCEIGDNVYIGANAVIDAGAKIGEATHIFPLVYIGHDTHIGKNCKIQANSNIGSDGFGYGSSHLGEHHYKPHLGRVIIGDNVDIGAGVCIDRGTYEDSTIGAGTKVDNMCHFGHNIIIGKNCLFAGGVMTAGSATIGDYCVFGGATIINGHISVTSKVMVGGRSAVNKSITEPGQYAGYPIQPVKDSLRTLTSLPHLPNLRKAVKNLQNKVQELSSLKK